MPKGVPNDLVRLEILRVLPEDGWVTSREIAFKLRRYEVTSYMVARFLFLLKLYGLVEHRPKRTRYSKTGFWRLTCRREDACRFFISNLAKRKRWITRRSVLPVKLTGRGE